MIMTKPNDRELTSYLAALHHLRETEQRLPPDELHQRGEDCPTPSLLIRFALRQTTPETTRLEQHVAGCRYCRLAIQSLTVALNDELASDFSEEAKDPLAPS
jgi:hypothetical protein